MKKRVVILGGGFSGIYTALHLEKALKRDEDLEVILVNRDNFILFTPMLHEVAASDLDPANIVNPIHKMLKRVRFFCGDVNGIDLENRRVNVSHGVTHHAHDLEYDALVIALGSTTHFFGLPGIAENALTMKTLGDAFYLRNHVIGLMEEADFECCKDLRQSLLTFVIAGGGFAGTETMGALNDYVHKILKFYPNLTAKDLRLVLVHPGKALLPELSEGLGRYAQQNLLARGVEVKTETKVKSYIDGKAVLTDGTIIPTQTLVWTAGTAPHPLLDSLTCVKERGRILVNECLEVSGHSNVFALGDSAMIPDKATGKFFPPTAQHAIREAKIAAHNVLAALHGGEKKPFHFKTLGQLASLGRRSGVAEMFGFKFSGFLAWWLWRTVYLLKLPRLEKKFRVALDWTLDLLLSKDIVQLLTVRNREGQKEKTAEPIAAVG